MAPRGRLALRDPFHPAKAPSPMRWIVALFFLLVGPSLASAQQAANDPTGSPKMHVYVGTYTGGPSKGIYLLELDAASGNLTPRGLAAESESPSFLAIHPTRKFLYAANEVGEYEGQKTGSVSSFAIDPVSGKLTALNVKPSGGSHPCFVTVDATGKALLVANYSGGTVASLPIEADGKLAAIVSLIRHSGSGPNKARQEGPHAHSINLDASNRLAVAADLGLDKLLLYDFEPKAGRPSNRMIPPPSGFRRARVRATLPFTPTAATPTRLTS